LTHFISPAMILPNMPLMIEQLTAFWTANDAALVGYANLSGIDPAARDGFPRGISLAVALDPRIIAGITAGPTIAYQAEYKIANALLEYLGLGTADIIKKNGYKAAVRLPTFEEDKSTLTARLPHKTVATRAGLGWIGKSALLITKEYGPAVRLVTVLTDAPLTTGKPIDESQCGQCNACVAACPAKAIAGKNWQAGMAREELYDAFKCRKTARNLSQDALGEEISICGICIVACPWTQKYLKKQS
jgi:epoxyqueuosine reductase